MLHFKQSKIYVKCDFLLKSATLILFLYETFLFILFVRQSILSGLFTLLVYDFGVKGVEVEEVYDLSTQMEK